MTMIDWKAFTGGAAEWQRDAIRYAAALRGRFITSYAQCESLLADVSVRVDARFIHLFEKRISALKQITSREGPFDRYAEEVTLLCNRLSEWSELRHFLVHGFAILEVDPRQNVRFEFRRYERLGEGRFELKFHRLMMDEFEAETERINIFCATFLAVFRRIYDEQNLEAPL
jgi:hypothetical protein